MNPSQVFLLVSVAGYMGFMLWIGFSASRKIKDTKDYIIAGGQLGWWFSIGTIFATWFGAETCMGSSRTAFDHGILGVIADPFGAGLCLILSGLFFARYFHKLKIETVVDFFEMRYGRKIAWLLGLLYIPVYLGWIGGQLLAFGFILHVLTGVSVMAAVIVSTAVVLLYTYTGGMWADAITDFYQMIFILVGLAILFPVLLADLGGWREVRAQIPDHFFYVYPHSSSWLDWTNYAQAWMMVGIGSLPAQDLFQRMMSPKSGKMAAWSSVIAGLMYMVIGTIPILLGIFGRVALNGTASDAVLMDLAQKYLPLPLMALLVGALLSAIMSSADSALLAPAGIIGNNLLTYVKPDAGDALKLKWCKRSIPIVGLLSLGLALYFQNIYALCTNAWGFLLVGVAAPLIAGVYWKSANTYGACASAITGTLSWLVMNHVLPEGYPTHLFAFGISWAALVIVSLLTQRIQKPKLIDLPTLPEKARELLSQELEREAETLV